ncbi:MAG: hypothetical protein JNJ54_24785 [Myxococcaceae bacterium]|nr:hypothetical protein [Myxococcaceae bacterium]
MRRWWLLVALPAVAALAVVASELDARRVWRHCQAPDFPFVFVEARLNGTAWLSRVRCRAGHCAWRSALNHWGCHVVDEGGRARPGGSG